MISIKKYLDFDPSLDLSPDLNDALSCFSKSYCSLLKDVGDYSMLACPVLGPGLQENFAKLAQQLSPEAAPPLVKETEENATLQLALWGQRTSDYFKQKTDEIKELLLALARTAEAVGERDQRYASQFIELTGRLQKIGDLEDIAQIRTSLVRSAAELKACVDKMAREGDESVSLLRNKVSTYQNKLEEAERLALRDDLTGLTNRRYVEEQIERRINKGQPFCALLLDLNGFKRVNDNHGHLAGDDLLKQFAAELRSSARAQDVVGRWGGDEFILVVDGPLQEAQSRMERVRKWVFGDYTIGNGSGPTKVHIDAAIGVAEWTCGETMAQILGRADKSMYTEKPAPNRK